MNVDQKPYINYLIIIIGAGAIGRALAVCLQRAGKKVLLVRTSVNGNKRLKEEVQVEFADGRQVKECIETTTLSDLKRQKGIFIISGKAFINHNLACFLETIVGNAPLVLLQNGLNIERPFLEKAFKEIYRCVLFATSQIGEDGLVRYRPVSASPVGMIRGTGHQADDLVNYLNTPDFQFRPELDIKPVIWKKTIINCAFNTICPLLHTDNGIFCKDPLAMQFAGRIIDECVVVAVNSGITLDKADLKNTLLSISRSSEGQYISTLQDIIHKRPTEIGYLNLEIAEIADKLGLGEQVLLTRWLGGLVKIKSECLS